MNKPLPIQVYEEILNRLSLIKIDALSTMEPRAHAFLLFTPVSINLAILAQ